MARKSRKSTQISTGYQSTEHNKTAVYLRLSLEDSGHKDGTTMENQKEYVLNRLSRLENINVVKIYADNGFSGTNFDRTAWNELLSDIRSKKVNCIAVKDLSRMGRNMTETGNYLEKVFPFLGVRVISLNDNYDSLKDTFSRSMVENAFKNLMNECYSRDISKKIFTGIKARRSLGYIQSGHISYGYMKSDDGRKLLIDDNTAPVVVKIFAWRKSGKRLSNIVNALNTLAIPSPGKYLYIKSNGKKYQKYKNSSWSFANVRHILSDRAYTGVLIQNKTHISIFESGKTEKLPESDWLIRENAHTPLVSKEDFEYIQVLPKKDHIRSANKNPLLSKVKCGYCSYNMTRYYKDKDKTYWSCTSHKTNLKESCNNTIRETSVINAVKAALNSRIDLMQEQTYIIDKILSSSEFKALYTQKGKDAALLENKLSQISDKIAILYEDLKQGIISRDEYEYAKAVYKSEYKEIKNLLANMEDIKSITEHQTNKAKRILKDIYAHSSDDEFIFSLVKYINIFNSDRIEVVFNFNDVMDTLSDFIEREAIL